MEDASVRLDQDIRDELEEEARRQHLSADRIANDAIKAYLDNQAFKREAIREAIAEADKGVFISSEAMHRWIEQLEDDINAEPPKPDIFLPHKA